MNILISGADLIGKTLTRTCLATMDGKPLFAAFTEPVVFMLNKLTGTGAVIARTAATKKRV